MTLPPDRGHVLTEKRHDGSMALDALDIRSCVELLVDDHRHVADAVASAAPALATLVERLVKRMPQGGRLIYLGAGTSGRLGVLDAAECPPTFRSDPDQVVGLIAGGDECLRRSAEGREDDPHGAHADLDALHLGGLDTLIGIAAGGTTAYVLGALAHARTAGVSTVLLTCAPPDTTPPGCDVIVLKTGPELLTGSTRLKAGSATKLALNIITTTAFVQLGKVYSNLMVDVKATNAKLTDRAIRVLQSLCPELDRAAAAQRLDTAGGDLKTAIVMTRLRVDSECAANMLQQNGGKLRGVIDNANTSDT